MSIFTDDECAALLANMAADEREAAILEAARKVADAAVEFQAAGNHLHLRIRTASALDLAIREYRALTEAPKEKNEK